MEEQTIESIDSPQARSQSTGSKDDTDAIDNILKYLTLFTESSTTTITRYIHVSYQRDLFLRPVGRCAPFFLQRARELTTLHRIVVSLFRAMH